MGFLARFLARQLWWGMLWFIRRPWIKRLQRKSTGMLGEKMRRRMQASLVRQNRWARRYGLRLLTLVVNLFFISVLVTAAYQWSNEAYASGLLKGANGQY